jgi:TPR repeat protein
MRQRTRILIALVFATALPSLAHADFATAMKQYAAGHYPEAHTEFLSLAELGLGAAQWNLAAMSLQGQGAPKDKGEGVGWLVAAAQNGYQGMPQEKIEAMRAKLSEAERQSAGQIVSQYGREALLQRVLPDEKSDACPGRVPAEILQMASLSYPSGLQRQDGIVMASAIVGTDGLAHDPRILAAAPMADFAAAAVDSLLKSRFKPAQRNGAPIAGPIVVKSVFMTQGGGNLWSVTALHKLVAAADNGEPGAQYIIGAAATLDRSLNIPLDRAQEMIVSSAKSGHPQAQYWVARRFQPDCDPGGKGLLWIRRAALNGSAPAQVMLATHLLREPNDEAKVSEARGLLEKAAESDDFFARKHAVGLLAASNVAAVRNPEAALRASKALLKSGMGADPQLFETVAAAQAANGLFEEAAARQETALSKAKALYWNTSQLEQRLKAYQARQAWTGDLFERIPVTTPPPPLKHEAGVCKPDDPRCVRTPDRLQTPSGTLIPK